MSRCFIYSNIYIYIYIHIYQQCVTIYHVPKCMSSHKATVVKTGRAHCFHDCIHHIYIYINIYIYIYIYIYIHVYILVNLYAWLTISSCYSSIHWTLELIERDGGLALCVIVVGLLVSRGC